MTDAELDELELDLSMAISCGDYGNDPAPSKCLELVDEVRRLRAAVSEEAKAMLADVKSRITKRGEAAERLADLLEQRERSLGIDDMLGEMFVTGSDIADALDAYRKAKGKVATAE